MFCTNLSSYRANRFALEAEVIYLRGNLVLSTQLVPCARLHQSSRILRSSDVAIVSLHLSVNCPRGKIECISSWSPSCTGEILREQTAESEPRGENVILQRPPALALLQVMSASMHSAFRMPVTLVSTVSPTYCVGIRSFNHRCLPRRQMVIAQTAIRGVGLPENKKSKKIRKSWETR